MGDWGSRMPYSLKDSTGTGKIPPVHRGRCTGLSFRMKRHVSIAGTIRSEAKFPLPVGLAPWGQTIKSEGEEKENTCGHGSEGEARAKGGHRLVLGSDQSMPFRNLTQSPLNRHTH